MNTLIKILGNTTLISIHEELFITMIIYFFSNKQIINILDFTGFRENKALILIPTIVSALISNIVRYSGYQNSILGFLAPTVLFTLILFINIQYNYTNKKMYLIIWQTLKGLVVAFFVVLGINLSIFSLIHQPMEIINNNIIKNFIYYLPCIVAQYLILFIIIQKYNKKINIIQLILKNKMCKNIIGIFITITTIFMIIYLKFAVYDEIFTYYEIVPMVLTLFLLICFLISFRVYKIDYIIKMKYFDEYICSSKEE